MSLSSASNWLFSFTLVYAIPYMIDPDKANLGSKVFFIWGSTCLGCLIFAIFCIWETKGLSLEQVNYLVSNSSSIRSNKFNKQLKSGGIMENEINNDQPNKSVDLQVELPNISTDIKSPTENFGRRPFDGETM